MYEYDTGGTPGLGVMSDAVESSVRLRAESGALCKMCEGGVRG